MEITARARNTDPATSHAAAASMNDGKALKHAEIVLLMVAAHPGLTSAELARDDGRLGHYQVNRRTRELVEIGKLREGPARRCTVLGSNCLTWWPVTAGQMALNLEAA